MIEVFCKPGLDVLDGALDKSTHNLSEISYLIGIRLKDMAKSEADIVGYVSDKILGYSYDYRVMLAFEKHSNAAMVGFTAATQQNNVYQGYSDDERIQPLIYPITPNIILGIGPWFIRRRDLRSIMGREQDIVSPMTGINLSRKLASYNRMSVAISVPFTPTC